MSHHPAGAGRVIGSQLVVLRARTGALIASGGRLSADGTVARLADGCVAGLSHGRMAGLAHGRMTRLRDRRLSHGRMTETTRSVTAVRLTAGRSGRHDYGLLRRRLRLARCRLLLSLTLLAPLLLGSSCTK